MRKVIGLAVLFIVIINMTGCATILKEKTTDVKIDSEPQGAIVYNYLHVYEKPHQIGITPMTININNRHNLALIFKKDGYQDKKVILRSGVAVGWQLASLCCGVLPAIPDFFFKSARNFDRKEIKVSLLPAVPNSAQQTGFTGSHADEIIKYKKLLDNGVITKEEFEQQKKYHLGS